jgi:hypothetical protein
LTVALSLFDVDAALVAALAALQAGPPDDAHPFALVGRWAGPVTADGLGEVASQYPCALLRLADEQATRVVDTAGSDAEDRAAAHFDVLVALEDPRALDDALAGGAGAPGLYKLQGAVLAALNGLAVTDAWFNRRVRYVATRNELIARGRVYVLAVAFEVLRDAEQATDPADGLVAITTIVGNENLISGDTADTYAPQPLDQFQTP